MAILDRNDTDRSGGLVPNDIYDVEVVEVVPGELRPHLRVVPSPTDEASTPPPLPVEARAENLSPAHGGPAAAPSRGGQRLDDPGANLPRPSYRADSTIRRSLHLEATYLRYRRRALFWFERGVFLVAHAVASAAHRRAPGKSSALLLRAIEAEIDRRTTARAPVGSPRWGGCDPRELLAERLVRETLADVADRGAAMDALRSAQREEVALLAAALAAIRDGLLDEALSALRFLEVIAPTAITGTLLAECYGATGRPAAARRTASLVVRRRSRDDYRAHARRIAARRP